MSGESLLSDELLRRLMAAGEVDVLVGLPTLNHADTIDTAARAVHAAFNGPFARDRTVLLNCDGGSSDGTPERVRGAATVEGETLLESQSLRTRHRISAPYHGVPGKAAAVRTIFAAADLLQARAVAVLDPEIVSVSADSVAALLQPVLTDGVDFVSPVYQRHPLDGPLITQVVRPLFRCAYGVRLREPLAGEFGCSGRFAAWCLDSSAWDGDELRTSIDLWLSGMAASEGFQLVETQLGPRRLAPRDRPGVTALVPEILRALFTCLRLHEAAWTSRSEFAAVPLYGPAAAPVTAPTAVDVGSFASVFRTGVASLDAILQPALSPATLEGLRAAAGADPLEFGDELWCRALRELGAAHRRGSQSRDHLLRAAVPLYLGRVAAFAAQMGDAETDVIEERLEALCLHFERFKGELVALWTAARGA